MNLTIAYLNHYHANTKTDTKVKERVGWSTVDVEVQDVPTGHLELVLQDNDGYFAGYDSNKAWSYDDHYWAVAEATNGVFEHRQTEKRNRYRTLNDKGTEGLANFDRSGQKAFAWATFEFRLFSRLPSSGVYATEPANFRNYAPGNKVIWDDRDVIEARVKRYYERNLLAADCVIYCRIDKPCLSQISDEGSWRQDYKRVLTPFGGFGDPLHAFAVSYQTLDSITTLRRRPYDSKDVAVFYNPIPNRGPPADVRLVRTLIGDLFSRHPWFTRQEGGLRRGTAKTAKALRRIQELWLTNYEEIDEDALDEAAQIMIDIAGPGSTATFLQAWLDRPITLWTGT